LPVIIKKVLTLQTEFCVSLVWTCSMPVAYERSSSI